MEPKMQRGKKEGEEKTFSGIPDEVFMLCGSK